jgi:hypothetical protein
MCGGGQVAENLVDEIAKFKKEIKCCPEPPASNPEPSASNLKR